MILSRYLTRRDLDPCATMNDLQEHGIVSDLCVTAEDVPDMDGERAVAWLENRRGPEQAMLL